MLNINGNHHHPYTEHSVSLTFMGKHNILFCFLVLFIQQNATEESLGIQSIYILT